MLEVSQGGPWHQHFWPWFIVLLLGTTVVAGIATVYIAFDGADALVVDDYYRTGKAINKTFEAEHEAGLREVTARVWTHDGVEIVLDLLGEAPPALEFALSHVTRAERDLSVRLERFGDGRYRSRVSLPKGRFYATLRPTGDDTTWRIRGQIELPSTAALVLEPSR